MIPNADTSNLENEKRRPTATALREEYKWAENPYYFKFYSCMLLFSIW